MPPLLHAFGLGPWWSENFSLEHRNAILAAATAAGVDPSARPESRFDSAHELLQFLLPLTREAGEWQAAQVIAEKLLAESTDTHEQSAPHIASQTEPDYADNPFADTPVAAPTTTREAKIPGKFLAPLVAEMTAGAAFYVAAADILVDLTAQAYIRAHAVAHEEDTGLLLSYDSDGYTLTITRPLLLPRVSEVGKELPVTWVIDQT